MRARSGPTPITSTRAPGKRSSASTRVETPLSTISGATNRPPERRSLIRRRRPAAGAVLDFRRALRLFRARRGSLGLGFVDFYAHLAPARLLAGGFAFALFFPASPAESPG